MTSAINLSMVAFFLGIVGASMGAASWIQFQSFMGLAGMSLGLIAVILSGVVFFIELERGHVIKEDI